MTKLLYISNARIPTQMAHGLQIVQNCEAFAKAGATVDLWHARRHIPKAEQQQPRDVWAYYDVERVFEHRALPTLDLVAFAGQRETLIKRALFYVQLGTFALSVFFAALFVDADLYYSRDPLVLWLLGWIKPREKLVYESHRLNQPGIGRRLQRQVLRRCVLTVAITPPLRDGLDALQANAGDSKSTLIVAHDGIRRDRFSQLLSQTAAREKLGWHQDLFIVGYMGRLQTLGMDKGLGTVIKAIAQLKSPSMALAVVGGPEALVDAYREMWVSHGLPATHFLYSGQVLPEKVPEAIRAFDLCVMPLPRTEFFAFYTSPMKLFEYMAVERAIIASDLPAYADVIAHEQTALLVPPSDHEALAAAILRLYDDPALRRRLATQAYERVMTHYTWEVRAAFILSAWQKWAAFSYTA